MHLRILSSVLLTEMFDLPGKELKCRKELTELLLKVFTKLCEVAGFAWVDLKLKSRTSYVL